MILCLAQLCILLFDTNSCIGRERTCALHHQDPEKLGIGRQPDTRADIWLLFDKKSSVLNYIHAVETIQQAIIAKEEARIWILDMTRIVLRS